VKRARLSAIAAVALVFGVALGGCKDKEKEMRDKIAADAASGKAWRDGEAAKAKPMVDALAEIAADARKLPPPTALPDLTKFKAESVRIVRLDYLERLLDPHPPELKEEGFPLVGETDASDWLNVVRTIARGEDFWDDARTKGRDTLLALSHLVVVRVTGLIQPKLGVGTFTGGQVSGQAFVYDLATKKPLGGASFTAVSSMTLDYDYDGAAPGAENQGAVDAVYRDLDEQARIAIREKFGVKRPPPKPPSSGRPPIGQPPKR
jgi:hypothetical protein